MTEVADRLEQIRKLAKESGVGWGAGGELKELPKVLWPDETPRQMVKGTYNNRNGILVATDRRLIFIDKGLISLTVEDFTYDKVTSIQYTTGFLLGQVDILAAGNRATISNVEKNRVRPFAEWVRAQISTPPKVTISAPAPGSNLDELVKLAELHKQGILTDDEYAAKKKQLLGI